MAAGTIGGGGSGVTIGTAGQIPFVNAGATDFTYASGFTFTAANYTIQGQSSNAILRMNDSVGWYAQYTANVSIAMDSAAVTLSAAQRVKLGATRFQMTKGSDVASASTLTFSGGNSFDITGATAGDHITTTNWQAGSEILLQFDSNPVINHNTGSPPGGTAAILLAGAANFSTTAGDTLSLWYDGAAWREKCRTVI